MTLDEAQKIAAIVSTADDGCPVCVEALQKKLTVAFPEYEWSYGPNSKAYEPYDWDARDGSDYEPYLQDVISARPKEVV